MKFDFIITLVTAEHVLSGLVALSQLLQKKTCDLIEAKQEAEVVIGQLRGERNDPMVWGALYDQAVDIAGWVGVVLVPQKQRIQRNRPNVPADNAKDYWQRKMHLPFVDHLIDELDTRLPAGSNRYNAQYLLPQNLQALNDNVADELFDTFQQDIAVSRQQFYHEINRWKARWTLTAEKPNSISGIIAVTNTDLYPGVKACLLVLLSMPVSTATAERSFSMMRRIKTYLRSTMTTDRMSGLGLLNIYQETEINLDRVADVFAGRKPHPMALLFRV